MTSVGLYVYKITLHDINTHTQVNMSNSGVGSTFKNFLPTFISSKKKITANNAIGRSWVLKPKNSGADFHDGIIKYGTHGHTSEIIDPGTSLPLFSRADHHIEQIPLYYQYFIGDKKNYALCAFQSFRTWSCVSSVNGELGAELRSFSNDTLYLKFQKVMPSELGLYKNAVVKSITLRKQNVKRDKFDVLRGLSADEIKVEVNLSVKRRSVFGKLKDVAAQIRENSANNVLLQDGLDFEHVTATVRVGDTYKKVGVLGPAVNAGVIDVTDEVTLTNGHPTFSSIAKIASSNIADFARILG